jgi:cardiolipin synthase A/B
MRQRRYYAMRGILMMLVGAFLTFVTIMLMPERRDLVAPVPHFAGVGDANFLRTTSATFGGDLKPGHTVETFRDGEEIYAAMIAAIDAAEVSVNFETYVYWSGEVATRFEQAFIRKALEGVEVRFLVDWLGSFLVERERLQAMKQAGVRVERFRALEWHNLLRVNNRTHRKVMVVDGRVGFTGGVGVADEWLGTADEPARWRENHYRVTGPAVADMQASFAEHWLEATGKIIQGEAFYPSLGETGPKVAQFIKSSHGGSTKNIQLMLLMAIAAAQESIRIGTPYFVPDDLTIAQLIDARRRGVEIEILVPGDNIGLEFVRHASRHFWGRLLREGIRIYEYQPTLYHVKVHVVDDLWTMIGSSNVDERAFRHDHEANLVVVDADFAASQVAIFRSDLAAAREVGLAEWEDRPLVTRIADFFWSRFRSQL